MSENSPRRIPAFCPLCGSRCGCEAVVENGRLVAIEPDPSHPTGKALCAKGRASPELTAGWGPPSRKPVGGVASGQSWRGQARGSHHWQS
jgi:anaerobic selenocysteine-containing dehydrogenase